MEGIEDDSQIRKEVIIITQYPKNDCNCCVFRGRGALLLLQPLLVRLVFLLYPLDALNIPQYFQVRETFKVSS